MEAQKPLGKNEQIAHWAIIGRLTASLFHEINNPMQAIQGSMSLALEELEELAGSELLRAYLELSLEESHKVVQLIARARRVYRPETSVLTTFDLNYLLHEATVLTNKYLTQRKVDLETRLMGEPLLITAVFGELSLAFLCPILQLADGIGANGGGKLILYLTVLEPFIQVILTTSSVSLPPGGFDLPLCHHVLSNYHGTVEQYEQDRQTIIDIKLPLSSVKCVTVDD